MKKFFSKLSILVAFSIFLVACGVQGPAETDDVAPGIDPPVVGNGGEVIFAQWGNPPSLDPHGANDTVSIEATSQIFEGLTAFNENGDIVPLLATDFHRPEPNLWEFTLRQGVYFHDGEPFNAYAVQLSIERLLDIERASMARFILEMVEEVIVVDEYTVQFVTLVPFSPLPAHLTHSAGYIISPASLEREDAGGVSVDELPVGTGPFVFESRIHGQELVMARNENYWGDIPTIETLRFLVVPEASQRFNMLLTGEANVTIVSAIDATDVRDNEDLELMEIISTRQNYVGFNVQVAPFDDIRVRQAIAMVLDLDAIIYGIAGMGTPAVGPLSPVVTGAATGITPITGTAEDAQALLAEAGFPDGFETTITLGAGRPIEEGLTAQILQANLSSIGIDATINEMEWGAFLDYTGAGNHEIFILGWTVATGDADYGVFPLFHSSLHGVQGNRTFYTNPLIDDLLEQARMLTDQDARNEIYAEITQILVYESPMISTFYPTFAVGINGIDNLFVDFNAAPYFHRVTLR